MSVIFRFVGASEIVEFLAGLPAELAQAVAQKMEARARAISDRVKQKLSGELLQVKTGRLRASIYARVYLTPSSITLSVGSRGDVPYAKILEYGGKTAAHIIEPIKGRALRFIGKGGAVVYARLLIHPGSLVREYAYLRGTLDEMIVDIRFDVLDALRDVVDRRKFKRLTRGLA